MTDQQTVIVTTPAELEVVMSGTWRYVFRDTDAGGNG